MKLVLYRGKYAIYSRDDQGNVARRSLGTDDKLEADRRLQEFKSLQDRRRASRGFTVAQLWEARQKALEGRRTAANMQWSGKAILPFFGHLSPEMINAPLARSYAEKRRAEGRQNGTILTEINHLRSTLSWARKEGMIDVDVALPAPSAPPPRVHFLTKQQAQQFLAACQYHHIKLFTILALTTGARATAILELEWNRVDLDRRLLELRTEETAYRKGRATVPINGSAYEALARAKEVARSPYVIEFRSTGEQLQSIKKGIKAAASRAELPWVSPHVFRHSAAVWMAEAGTSMEEIAQFLGHTDINVTRRIYARFSPDHLRRAAQALELA